MKRLLLITLLLPLLFTACENEEFDDIIIDLPEVPSICHCEETIEEFWGSSCISTCDYGYWGNFWFVDQSSWVWQPWPLPGPGFPDPVILPEDVTVFDENEILPIIAPVPAPQMNMYIPVEVCEGVSKEIPSVGCYHIEYQVVEDYDFGETGLCSDVIAGATPIRIVSIEEAGPCAFPAEFQPVDDPVTIQAQ